MCDEKYSAERVECDKCNKWSPLREFYGGQIKDLIAKEIIQIAWD